MFGGARGGGKTDAGMAWLLYYKDNPLFRGLVIRLNAKDLADWVDRARRMYAGTMAEFVGQPTEIRFPSGAIIRTGHLKDENAYTQYQGHEYHRILIEELTQIPQEKYYEQLISSCRSTVPDLPPRVFCTTNPGGVGHQWVKERWRIVGMPQEPVVTYTPEGGRVFIPSRVADNPALMKADPRYVEMLKGIKDENLRKSWLDGSWDDPVVEGVVYKNELQDAFASGRLTHVPHDPRYPVYTYWDIGIGDNTAIGFFQKVGEQWRMIDYYSDSGKGISHYVQVVTAKGYFYGAHYGPHDLEQREWSSGESRKTIAGNLGIYFQIVPKMTIEDGLNAVRMKFPLLWIDIEKCGKFLDALKFYRYEYDETKQEYKTRPLHDWTSHAADMIRYWAVQNDPVYSPEQAFSLYAKDYG